MDSKAKVVVVYFGAADLRGCRLALAVAEGAWDAGAEVRVRCVERLLPPNGVHSAPEWIDLCRECDGVAKATAEDLTWADAMVFGSATGRNALPGDATEVPDGRELAAARDEGRRLAETVHRLKLGPSRLAVA
jgi:hypothetical protein